jgi:predicted amidohydrolase YtcJ
MTIPRPARLREAHVHLAWHGRALGMLRLGDCTSVKDCLAKVASEAARLQASGARDWLMGVQLRIESWTEPRWPTREELDRVTGTRPAWLMSFDHHSLVASSAALAAAGFVEGCSDPQGGVLGRDETGRLTGLCLEAACRRVREASPEPPPAELKQHVRTAIRDLAAMGFVEVHDLLTQPWLPAMLAELHDAGELPIRVGLFPLVEHLAPVAAGRQGWSRPGLELLGGKVFVDGTLNARTAWMLAPYADAMLEHPCGTALMSVEQIASAMRACTALEVGFAAHAIGDGAVRACLDAAQSLPPLPRDVRRAFRIEHAELIDQADVPRFAELGLTASVQPCHLLYDIEALERSLPDRLHRVLPLRDLVQAGLVPGRTLIFGSDTPIVRPNPEDSIQAAVHRRRADSPASRAIAPLQAISEDEAWACFAAS